MEGNIPVEQTSPEKQLNFDVDETLSNYFSVTLFSFTTSLSRAQ